VEISFGEAPNQVGLKEGAPQGGKTLEIANVKLMKGLNNIRGLMFRKKENSPALLFNLKNESIHSLFVFFDFLVLWLDDKNNVVDWKVVRPWRFHVKSDKEFSKILEIPVNRRYHSIVSFVVGERFKKNKRL